MRIAYLTQSYPPMVSGAALVVRRLAEGMAARGHAVLVLAASDQGRAYSEVQGSLRLTRLAALPNPLRVGQHFLLWPQTEIAAALNQFQPDILHLHDPLVMSLATLRAAKNFTRHIPRLLTLHQLPWFIALYAPSRLRQSLESILWAYGRWLYPHFEAVVTPSQMIADMVSAHSRQRPQPITNGVDTERFTPQAAYPGEAEALRRKYGLDPALPVILYAGRVDRDKRVDRVIRAAAGAMRSVKAQLLIVGNGKQLPAMIQLSAAQGIRSLSHFVGYVSMQDELPGLYRLASVFVTASEVEIQSSVVLEAAASGLPVVAVRASSMPELVEEGVTGYLVAPGDEVALAERLVALLQDPARGQAMGRAALTVAQRHSNGQALVAHEQLYRSCLPQP